MEKTLSDLEYTVLGVIWRDGPCTPYYVRTEFTKSPSSHWSGSAGSIYPLIRRLEKAGFVHSVPSKQGKRVGRNYQITPKGRRQLEKWLSPPMPADAASIQFDPLRTRMFFLGAVHEAEAISFLDHAGDLLKQELHRSEEFLVDRSNCHDRFGVIAAKAALQVARARLASILQAKKELNETQASR